MLQEQSDQWWRQVVRQQQPSSGTDERNPAVSVTRSPTTSQPAHSTPSQELGNDDVAEPLQPSVPPVRSSPAGTDEPQRSSGRSRAKKRIITFLREEDKRVELQSRFNQSDNNIWRSSVQQGAEAQARALRNQLDEQQVKDRVYEDFPSLNTPSEVLYIFRQFIRPDSLLFHRYFAARGRQDVRPAIPLLKLITLAFIALGRIADEDEIIEWLEKKFPWYLGASFSDMDGATGPDNLRTHVEAMFARNMNTYDSVFTPVNPATRRRGAAYELASRGRVWRLPSGHENHVFEDWYGYDKDETPLWRHPTPKEPEPKVNGNTAILGLSAELRLMIFGFIFTFHDFQHQTLQVRQLKVPWLDSDLHLCVEAPEWAQTGPPVRSMRQLPDIANQDGYRTGWWRIPPTNWLLEVAEIEDLVGIAHQALFKENHFILEDEDKDKYHRRVPFIAYNWLRSLSHNQLAYLDHVHLRLEFCPSQRGPELLAMLRRLGNSCWLRSFKLSMDVRRLPLEERQDFRNIPGFQVLRRYRGVEFLDIDITPAWPEAVSELTACIQKAKLRNGLGKGDKCIYPALVMKPLKESTIFKWRRGKFNRLLAAFGRGAADIMKKKADAAWVAQQILEDWEDPEEQRCRIEQEQTSKAAAAANTQSSTNSGTQASLFGHARSHTTDGQEDVDMEDADMQTVLLEDASAARIHQRGASGDVDMEDLDEQTAPLNNAATTQLHPHRRPEDYEGQTG